MKLSAARVCCNRLRGCCAAFTPLLQPLRRSLTPRLAPARFAHHECQRLQEWQGTVFILLTVMTMFICGLVLPGCACGASQRRPGQSVGWVARPSGRELMRLPHSCKSARFLRMVLKARESENVRSHGGVVVLAESFVAVRREREQR